ncbi:MAG: PPOX class F420-dependent oxidoreductase [Caldilineaceae bacterium]|uniref:PPOX class F420-dependent oxidoreductase n=1 Tax=Caldilineaceae bacterium SB0661_bin_32 TaxID=2605255 RepID=A0A6B1DAN4_9CHLR|nr:PPOX class F420-dependent oxidoreductase [Caldilineaceae bacterium]MDE0631853.1 PPOX class F420-dependent oxidoreductase [Caldilineaceae bacterium]MXZ19042.1 PPOX class F420-dependent oxidoreductase [Caldilineaceae bacterium SB0665_bin_25]MYC97110.1 PPOX class F420-dependent oxidoreductase [Caldilineaceae bacterium SB0661_bin_32]
MQLSDIGNPKYIALETYRKSGQAVKTPVWTVAQGSKLLVWTQGDSWKVKRARNNPRVRVAICDMRGNVQGPWAEGVVTSISGDEETKRAMSRLLRKKYPLMVAVLSLIAVIRGTNKGQVVMEIGDP